MKNLKKLTVALLAGFALSAGAVMISGVTTPAYAADCVANNNLSETANDYISRCRKGSIRGEFPGELVYKTLGDIKKGSSATYKKGWKLLNDNRFKK